MNLLGSLGMSLLSSPLVKNTLGSLASGALDLLKTGASNLIGQGINQISNYGQQAQKTISNYNPDIKRLYSYDMDQNGNNVDDEFETPKPVRRRRATLKRKRRTYDPDDDDNNESIKTARKRVKRIAYNPDLITEYE